jgi:L-lactate dehydrogenase complex protein LldG
MMKPNSTNPVMDRVRRALGRTEAMTIAPVPPRIDEPIARLVYTNIGLPELFQKRATEMKMLVELVRIEELLPKLSAFLHEQKIAKVMLSATDLLTQLNASRYLSDNGFQARTWRQICADDAYQFDAGVTEVDFAIAETGTLVIRHRAEHGRLLSLVPFVHVAIVQPRQIVPDLIDIFELLAREGTGSGVTMISGPSKTADIEMNTVTGVHGPNIVKAFVLS